MAVTKVGKAPTTVEQLTRRMAAGLAVASVGDRTMAVLAD
jgi:hypothetical protein